MSNYIEERPWGKFEILLDAEYTKVKRITVKPGGRLSYQSHKHRDEHWIGVQGEGEVTIDGCNEFLPYGQSIFIDAGRKHRVENNNSDDFIFVEVQTGDYFGEDDIERFEDDYGRE
jgi:mannose-6-phosphate isomerase-like protein (cupin superfamily)